jgi:hypothetical protein
LLEVDLQNRATWQLLEAATKQRDACLRYHGGLVVLLSALLPHLTVGQMLAVAVAGTAFLALASGTAFVAAQVFRVQQFQVGLAERFSRNRLAGDNGTWFGDLESVQHIRPLGMHGDPMGFAVRTTLWLLLLDVFAFFALWVVTIFWDRDTVVDDGLVVPLSAAVAVATAMTSFIRIVMKRVVEETEMAADKQVGERLRRLGR